MKKDNLNPCFTKRVISDSRLVVNAQRKTYMQLVRDMEKCRIQARKLTRAMTEASREDPNRSKEKLRMGSKSLNDFPTYEFIRRVLMRSKKPMHIKEILTAIEEEGWITSNPNSRYHAVASALRCASNLPLFRRTSPGMYAYNPAGYARMKRAA